LAAEQQKEEADYKLIKEKDTRSGTWSGTEEETDMQAHHREKHKKWNMER
jgi:hypothetical protein